VEVDFARVLASHAGFEDVVVDLASSVDVVVVVAVVALVMTRRLEAGVIALRLAGRMLVGEPSVVVLTRRVPNLAFAEDSLEVYDEGPEARPRTALLLRGDRAFVAVPVGDKVILSAPQYEKLILLFRSESSES